MSGAPPPPDPETFLSGDAGDVAGTRRAKRAAADLAFGFADRLAGTRRALDRLARRQPSRSAVVASIYRPGSLLPHALDALGSGRHDVRLVLGSAGEPEPALAAHTVASGLGGGKFQNLNRLLDGIGDFDWLLCVDDDVRLPERFLDRLLAACEAFGFDLAQPAQTQLSHSAWRVARRRPAVLARETRFVEIGPVTAFSAPAAAELVPFPELRYGWGLDLHWAAVAAERGWRLGVVDALAVRHERAPVADAYPREEAIAEARSFLSGRPHLPRAEADVTLAVHRRAPA